jgi:hypothetical protein
MQRTRIAKLTAGIDGVTIKSPREVVVVVYDNDGDVDLDATETAADQVRTALEWHGIKAAGGHWIFLQDHRPTRGDWNDRHSEHHY